MNTLNSKIKAGRQDHYNDAQVCGVHGLNTADDAMKVVKCTDDNALVVDVHGGATGSGDMKARTNITDPATSTFLKCNPDGTLELTAELDTSALAKESVQTDGTQKAQVLGNTEGDGSGTATHIHTDASGNVNAQIISTVNIAPANNSNSGINDGPANSLAVGLRARTDIADSATETFLLCDASGHLQADIIAGGGGGTQYSVGTTGMATGTGTLMIGNFAGAAKEVAVNSNGQVVQELGFINSSVLGQDTAANSLPVVIASDNVVDVSNASLTDLGSAVNEIGDAISATSNGVLILAQDNTSNSATLNVTAGGALRVDDGATTTGSDVSLNSAQQVLCYGRDNGGTLDALRTDAQGHLEVVVDDFVKGQDTSANSFPVVLASDDVVAINATEATNVGTANNLANNISLTSSGGTSSTVDTTNMNVMNILYEDTNTGNFDGVEVHVSFDNSTYYLYTTLFPNDNLAATKRTATTNLNMHGLKYVKLINNSATTFTNVYAMAVGSP